MLDDVNNVENTKDGMSARDSSRERENNVLGIVRSGYMDPGFKDESDDDWSVQGDNENTDEGVDNS